MRKNSFKGRGGGGGTSNASDNLFSTDAFEFVLGISEGPIGGIVGDTPEERLQNIFIDGVPIFNNLNESNFDDSSLFLRFENGTSLSAADDPDEGQTPIWYGLGGQNVTSSVSSTLAYQGTVTQITPQTTSGFDEIELRFTVSQLVKYTDNGSKQHTVRLRISYRNLLDSEATVYFVNISGKTTLSPFVHSENIVLPRTAPDDQFELEVTRITEDSDEEEIAVISWTSYELLTRTGDAYTPNGVDYDYPDLEYHPGVAMMHIFGVLGQQLDSIPTVNANYHGLECAIPSNYDPITKTYSETSVWDGQFKAAKHWTDNPFWIAHELITNPRWGMVRFNPRVTVNRYEVYRMAKYADGYDLDTGEKSLTNPITGETEAARFTFNVVLQQPSDGWSILKYVLGSAFARPIETDVGEIKFIADLPELPIATITPEMCVSLSEGSPFNYNFSAISERHNAVTSSYLDKNLDYQQQYVAEIRDEEQILKFGLNEHVFEAAGATDVWEVKRRMTLYISSVTSEIRTVNFTAMLNGLQFEPMDIINVADPTTGHAFTGRAVGLSGDQLTLRDPVYFDEASTYKVTVMGKTEDYVYDTIISQSQVDQAIYTLTLEDTLPTAENFNRYAPVVISAGITGQTIGLPKPWRILSITESDDINGAHQVTAQEVNLNKHIDADNLVISETPQYNYLNRPEVRKVENLRVVDEEHYSVNGVEQINLWLAWEAGATLPPGGYYEIKIVEQSLNGREYLTKIPNTYFEVQNVKVGEISISVKAVQGETSSPETLLEWSTTRVTAGDLLDQGVVPQIDIDYKNHVLSIHSEVYYDFGTADRNKIDLLDTNGVLGIQFKIYNDIDPLDRELLIERVVKSDLVVTQSDFEIALKGVDLPNNLYITARVVDLQGEFYPDLFNDPIAYQVSTPVGDVNNLAYQYIFSAELPHTLTWDDESYGYEITLYNVGSNTIIERKAIYESSINFGFLKAGTDYRATVKGFSNILKYGDPTEVVFTVTAPATPPEAPTISNEGGIITVTPLKVDRSASYYEFKYHSEDVIGSAKDYSNGDTITLYAQKKDQEFHIWFRLKSPEGFGAWTKVLVVATEAFQQDLDELFNDLINAENAPWGQSLSSTISMILADIQTWSTQTSALGTEYQTLIYSVTEIAAANSVNQLEVLAVKQLVGDTSVQAQIATNNQVQIGYEDENGDWIVGAPLARSFEEVKVTNLAGDSVSVISYMQALENSVGGLEAAYYLGVVDEEQEFTGLEIQGGSGSSNIRLYMDNLKFASQAGVVFFALNTVTGKLEITADTDFTGTLRAARKVNIETNFMEIEDLAGFGPDNLCLWKGPPILDANGDPDYTQLTKANASFKWEDLTGGAYFGGSVTAGLLSHGLTNEQLTENPSLTLGPFATNGLSKNILYSFGWTATSTLLGACPSGTPLTPSATLTLQRSIDNAAWTTLATQSVTGSVTRQYDSELDECTELESASASFTYTDNNDSTDIFKYRVVVSNQQRYHTQQNITEQTLSLLSTEGSTS